jgi:hypothetical protein
MPMRDCCNNIKFMVMALHNVQDIDAYFGSESPHGIA